MFFCFGLKMEIMKIREVIRLSFSLAKTNFKLRNEGSYLGIAWYLLGPLALFFIILFIRGEAFPGAIAPEYPIYLLIGITGFNFFRQSITTSIQAITMNASFIKSINNISLETFVVATVFEATFSHVFEVVLVAAFMAYFGVPLLGILLYPISFLVFFPFILGAGFFCATIGTFTADLDNLWMIASQLLFFVTPIFYTATPGTTLYAVNLFNPAFYFISISRSFLIDRVFPPLWMFGVLLGMGVLICFIGVRLFEAKKYKLAEQV